MVKFAGSGRTIAASLLACSAMFGATAHAQEVNEDQIKAARATISSLGVTDSFDNILPNVAEQLKGTLIQASPNYQDVITKTVDEKAIALAPRRADLEREAASIYAKTFSVEELNAISAFYGSEAGKKLLRDGPIATREMLKAADIWASGISRDLAAESDKALEASIGAAVRASQTQPGAEQPAPAPAPAQ